MDLALKMPWLGVLVFFCAAMVPSESEDSCRVNMVMQSKALLHMIQVTLIRGNIMEEMISKAMKTGDQHKMIKGIKGLAIEELVVPVIIIIFIEKDKVIIKITVIITVSGKSFIGGAMKITVATNSTMTGQISSMPNGELILKLIDCKVVVTSCKTNLPSSMLPKIVNKFLDSTLAKVMPTVMCPAGDLILIKFKASFHTILAKKPIGNIGYIVYVLAEKPVVYTTHILFIVKVTIEKKNGAPIPMECQSLPKDIPTKEGKSLSFFMPIQVVHALMILYREHLKTTITKIKGSVPTSDQLKKILPGVRLPAGKKLRIQLTHREPPLVSVSSTGNTITTHIQASFLDVKNKKELLSIKMVHECSSTVSTKQEVLVLSLKAGSCRTMEISSSAGDVSGAKKYMETVMDAGIPTMNGVFTKNPVPLPNIMNVTNTPDDAEYIFGDNMMSMYKSIEAYSAEEMAKEIKKQCAKIKL